MARKDQKADIKVEALTHREATRKNIPTAEFEAVVEHADKAPVRVAIERRNRDLDPQLVWRGKEAQDESDLIVQAPPLYIQEKVHPKALIDDLLRTSRERAYDDGAIMANLFSDFNGIPHGVDKTEFYQHDQNWSNRMILGDSLQVMASLAEREGLRGKVQCIYIDPPYGIKFNSNFQWSTTTRDVKDGNTTHITREPEQVKAFRDTWRDGVHSYLSYLRDRLIASRDLLRESGSVFLQIGDENVHLARALLDEVYGAENFVSQIAFKTTSGAGSFAGGTNTLAAVSNYLLWYARDLRAISYRQPYKAKDDLTNAGSHYNYNKLDFFDAAPRRGATDAERGAQPKGARLFRFDNMVSQTTRVGQTTVFPVNLDGRTFTPRSGGWKTNQTGMARIKRANRLGASGQTLCYIRYLSDFSVFPYNNVWEDTITAGFASDKLFVVQTNPRIIERCMLMASNPGDLVLDPTCGSGTTAFVAEQWGRRWITVDTSRVALALARARIMGARYPYYLLIDSPAGQQKEAEITATMPDMNTTYGDVRRGFVYERVPHVTLKSIANNAEIETIWNKWQAKLEPLRASLNEALEKSWEEWQVPRDADSRWDPAVTRFHGGWWDARIARQREIDASIAAKADFEYLYDRPYEDKKTVRVAGPFTVESLSPHRMVGVGTDDELLDPGIDRNGASTEGRSFVDTIIDNLKTAGVQQAHKTDKIVFTSLVPWPGEYVCAEGRYREGDPETGPERRAAIFIGPEFGTVAKPDLTAAAREAADGGFDVLIACAFAYDAHSSEVLKLGRLQVLKARMNADLHMAEDLKKTEKANLFVIFGEPDVDILEDGDKVRVKINGVDVFVPGTGEVRSDGPDGIACWFIDTNYNEESFFVRHAYFLGANDPYDALKKTLKAEIDEEAWESLHSAESRPFPKPSSGRIAVKVINHLGDEVMKVFKIE